MIPELTPQEDGEYGLLLSMAKEKAEPEAAKVKGAYIKTTAKQLEQQGLSPSDALAAAEMRCGRNGTATLHEKDLIHFRQFGMVPVRDVLADPGKYHNQSCADPLEPEEGTSRAKLYSNPDGSVILSSRLHGGQTFFLRRAAGAVRQEEQPAKPMFITLSDVKDQSFVPEWLIYRHLEANSQNLLFGDSQSKKTFILIDQMMSIAAGIDWCGQPVKRGGVVFLFGEGSGGIVRRCRAWMNYHNIPEEELDNLLILNENLFVSLEENSSARLIDQIHWMAEVKGIQSIKLIAWDTASSLLGIDENRADEVSEGLRVIRQVGRQCDNASDEIVHHMGHGAKDRPRGSYAWMANVDAWHLVEKGNQFQSKIKAFGKMKDADPITYNRIFDFNYQRLGMDEYLNDYGSLVACHNGNEEADTQGGQKMNATDQLRETVKNNAMGIFKESLIAMGESLGFKNADTCRRVVERLIKNSEFSETDGKVFYENA